MIRIGVDVGGTNTDAVVMEGSRLVAAAKVPTSDDVTAGIVRVVARVLDPAEGAASDPDSRPGERIQAVMLGTTHFVNALLEGEGLARTAVLRLCGPATRLLPPFCDWPPALVDASGGRGALLPGGHEFDGWEIVALDEDAILAAAREARDEGAEAVAVVGVFSPVNPEHEERARRLLDAELPELDVTLSCEIGRIGLLERENAAALNAALSGVARRTVPAIREALADLGLDAPLFFSQNDGTLMDAHTVARFPVRAISSGPTNSMRGAALLSDVEDGVVVDIGGTTTDVGALVGGFPRTASTEVELAGVRTNFRMPDLLSVALGGGSRISTDPLEVGPGSVGARIGRRARVFGGETLTATDLAVAGGLAALGRPERVEDLPRELVERGLELVRRRIEEAVDRMRLTPEPVPVVLVGGGSLLVEEGLEGSSRVVRPEHAEVANAIGAAIAQVGGEVDRVYSLARTDRQGALVEARSDARRRCVEAGADADTVDVVDVEEVPLTYLPGNATRIRVKAVGRLAAVGR